jgi:pyridoxal phosphate enzyme (YggS family)
MAGIAKAIKEVRAHIPADVTLVCVSKFHPEQAIREAYDAGERHFGESRVQELQRKVPQLPADICWHFIGHLQTNKVKYIAPYVSMIETVDSIRLLREIEKQAAKVERVIDVLLELHIADEETKSGMSLDECRELLADGEWKTMEHIRIRGIMMMASNVDDDEQIRQEFITAADFFDEVKAKYFADDDAFSERSYGMSGDYLIAQECRSTMVRIGTTIFGPRVY